MTVVDQPAEERAFTIAGGEGGVSIVIPAVRIQVLTTFTAVWLTIMLAAGHAQFSVVNAADPITSHMILGKVIWSVILFYGVSVLMCMLSGCETIRVTAGNLYMTRRAFGLTWRWIYHGESIRDLRVESRPWLGTPRGGIFPFLRYSRFGAVRFSYRGGTRDLALGLAETDARAIHDWLKERLPGNKEKPMWKRP